MELHEIIIKPGSGFITPLKGDTIFGHFCWQAINDPCLLEKGFEHQLAIYPEEPFAVFSSAFPKIRDAKAPYLFKRPEVPIGCFPEIIDMSRKEKIQYARQIKKTSWLCAGTDLLLDLRRDRLYSDQELTDKTMESGHGEEILQPAGSVKRYHNTIQRLAGTTGTGMFSPFETDTTYYCPKTVLVLFVLIQPKATDIDRVVTSISRIGKWGFGKDAGTGMGRFDVLESHPLALPDLTEKTPRYTLAPCVPEKNKYREKYFTPFIRFGKHGDRLATSENPFKNPVIMADEGAVLIPEKGAGCHLPYAGRCITHVSKAMPETVVQGYAPVLPIRLGGQNE